MRRCLPLFVLALPLAAAQREQGPVPVALDQEAAAEAAPAHTDRVDIATLVTRIEEILDEENVPGASIALVDRERTIWAGGVGKADVAADVDVTADHLFRIGSISKSFNALAVLRAVEAGVLDLDTPVRDLAPEVEFTNRWEETHPVTIAMVMEHTAGFDDIHFREYAKVDDPGITLAEGLAYNPRSRTSRWKPGTHMSYCNAGPPIAAYVVEKLTGQTFEAYVREQVLAPLGMETSTFRLPADGALMAKGYEGDGTTVANYDHIIIRPSGAMNASAREMARYLRMMIHRGTLDDVDPDGRVANLVLLSPASIDRMETPTTTLAARVGHDYGYGLGNYGSVVEGHLFHGHNGGITGFVSTSAYSSALGIGFYASINKASGQALREIAGLLVETLTEGIEAPEGPRASLSDEELRKVAGYYQIETPRQQLTRFAMRFFSFRRVLLEEGELYSKPLFGGEKTRYVPVSATSFRREDEPAATIFFVEDEEGQAFTQAGLGTNRKKLSGFSVFLQLGAAAVTLVVLLSSILFALVWIPAKLFRRLQSIPLRTVLVPLLATLSVPAAYALPLMLSSNLIQDLGNRTWVSLAVFVGSLVFAAMTLLALSTWLRSRSVEMPRALRAHALLVSLGLVVLLVYLGSHGLIGLRTWAY